MNKELQHGVPFFEMTKELQDEYFTEEMVEEIDNVTEKSNEEGRGDHMILLLKKR